MADPLSIAASVAGLITLADVAISRTCKFIKSCRSAVKDASRLLKEVQNLLGILRGLHSLSSQIDNAQLSTHIPIEQITHCEATLRKIQTRLADSDPAAATSHLRKIERTLKWPFTSAETSEILADLARYKETFDLTISMDILEAVLIQSSAQEEIATEIRQIKRDVRELCRIHISRERQGVLDFFAVPSVKGNHHMNRKLRHPGTGAWFIDGQIFQRWMDERKSKLWLFGIPGAGKSVLSAAAIDETLKRANSSFAVLYMYCDYKDAKTQDPAAILAGLVEQMARQSEKCFDLLENAFKVITRDNSHSGLPVIDDLVHLLHEMADCFDDVAVLLDGLDECDQAGEIASILAEIADNGNFKLIISSRDEFCIRQELEQFEHVEVSAHESDLRLYVASEIEVRTRKRKLQIENLDLKETILERLVKEAAGMFRWVACQIDHLCELPDDAARRNSLEDLPQGLNSTYERMLLRISQKHERVQNLVEKTLKWLVRDHRHIKALTGSQLRAAVAVHEEKETFDPEAIPTLEMIAFHCSSLVRFTDGEDSIELAHFSVEQYLRAINPCAKPPLVRYAHMKDDADGFKTTTCLTFVLSRQFENICRDFRTLCQRSDEFPFFQHAASMWPYYAGDRCPSTTELRLLQKLFAPKRSTTFESWAQMFGVVTIGLPLVADINSMDDRLSQFMRQTALATSCTPLQYAAIIGSTTLIEWLVKLGCDVNVKNLLGPPLFCSTAGKGAFGVVTSDEDDPEFDPHAQRLEDTFVGFHFHPNWTMAVETLLQHGADTSFSISYEGKRSKSILCLAIEMGCADVLLQCGLKLDEQSLDDVLLDFQRPCIGLQQLIDHVDPDQLSGLSHNKLNKLRDRQGVPQITQMRNTEISPSNQTADPTSLALQKADLRHACEIGDVSVMVYLLEEFELSLDDDLLHNAIRHSQVGAVECLLKYGANVDSTEELYSSPLVTYINTSNDIRILRILLLHGANTQFGETQGREALQACLDKGDLESFECIINSGLDLTATSKRLENLLHEVAKLGIGKHYEIVRDNFPEAQVHNALLQQDSDGLLPLHVAAKRGCGEILGLLLRDTPDLTVADNDGRNVGHFAAALPFHADDILRRVAAAGVSLTETSKDHSTAIHILLDAISSLDGHRGAHPWVDDYLEIVAQVITASPTIVNATRIDKATPMHILCEAIVSTSKQLSCDRLIHCAPCQMLLTIFRQFLLAGANIEQESENGQSIGWILVEGLYHNPSQEANRVIVEALIILADTRSPSSVTSLKFENLPILNIVARAHADALSYKLIDAGTDVDDRPGKAPTEPASQWLDLDHSALELFCKYGCSERVAKAAIMKTKALHASRPGQGLLHIVAIRKQYDEPSMKRLIEAGAEFGSLDVEGMTPLMIAVNANNTQHIAALLEQGACLSTKNSAGTSVAAQACKDGSLAVVKLMSLHESFWTDTSTLQLRPMTKKETRTVSTPKRNPARRANWYEQYVPRYEQYRPSYEYTDPKYSYAFPATRRPTVQKSTSSAPYAYAYYHGGTQYGDRRSKSTTAYSRRYAVYEDSPPPYNAYPHSSRSPNPYYDPVPYYSTPAKPSPRRTYEYVEESKDIKEEKTIVITIKHALVDRLYRKHYRVGPIELCVFHRHHDVVKDLLEKMKQTSVRPSIGCEASALFIACWNDDVETVKLLVEAGMDANQAEVHFKLTPLHVAVVRESESLTKALLDAGCNRFATDNNGRTAVFSAFMYNQKSIARQILAHASESGHLASEDGDERSMSPRPQLISANAFENLIDDGNKDLLRLLISNGHSVDEPVTCGCSPLLYALGESNPTMALAFLNLGASPLGVACKSKRHRTGYTAYHYAVEDVKLSPVLERLLGDVPACELSIRDSPAHPLHIAILKRNKKALTYILRRYKAATSCSRNTALSQSLALRNLESKHADTKVQPLKSNIPEDPPATNVCPDVQPTEGSPKSKAAKFENYNIEDWTLSKPNTSQPTRLSDIVESDEDAWHTFQKPKSSKKSKQRLKDRKTAQHETDAADYQHAESCSSSTPHYSASLASKLLCSMLSRTVRGTALDTEFSLPKDWSFKDIPQGTPLHIAAEIEYLDAVVLLLKAGANIDAVNEDLETALYSAVVAKKPAIVQLLLKNGANVNVRDWKGCSIVHAACTGGGDIKILRLLHSVGADFSCRDGQGSTPLHVACKESTPGVVHYLLSLGLDSIAADYHGTIPQDLLVQYGLQHSLAFVLNFISEHQPFLSTLAMAWSDTDTLMLRKMGMRLPQDSLTLYANAHFCEAGGTPLYLAALSGHVQVCDILRRFGALVNLEGGQEGTPLMAACYQGRLNAAQYLIRAGAEISYWKRGRLVSALEAAKRFPEIVRWILVGRYTEQKILTFGKSEIPDGTRSKPSWNTVHSLDVVFLEEWDTYSRSQVMQQTSRTFTCSNDGCCEMMELATA